MSKEFDEVVDKVINAIKEIEPTNDKEKIHLLSIQYFMSKMCQSEEIFDDNLMILDKYSQNGINKQKKLRRIDLMEE